MRSSRGWKQVKSARDAEVFLKSDERILGDSGFVDAVLDAAEEGLERKQRYLRQGVDLETLARLVADLLELDVGEIRKGGKQPKRVQARSLFCFWSVRELGLTATSLAGTLHLTQPAVTIAVQRGEKLAGENGWQLDRLIGTNL